MRFIDLTYGLSKNQSRYPTDPAPKIEIQPAEEREGRIYSAVTTLAIRPHQGTHIDAPAHKVAGGKTIEQYEIEKFVNKALLLDLTPYRLPINSYLPKIDEEIIRLVLGQEQQGQIIEQRVTALLFRTGYDQIIEQNRTENQAGQNNFPYHTFPYFTPAAAKYIINLNRSLNRPLNHSLSRSLNHSPDPALNLIGLDSFSVDQPGSNSESHRLFFSQDILILETLVNLHSLAKAVGKKVFQLHSAPIKYDGADAAQARAYALLEGPEKQ